MDQNLKSAFKYIKSRNVLGNTGPYGSLSEYSKWTFNFQYRLKAEVCIKVEDITTASSLLKLQYVFSLTGIYKKTLLTVCTHNVWDLTYQIWSLKTV